MAADQSFAQRIRQQLEDWDYQLDRFEHRMQDLSADVQKKARARLEEFRQGRHDLETKLKSLEETSERALEDLKDGIEIAWDGLKTGFYAARSEFEDDDKD